MITAKKLFLFGLLCLAGYADAQNVILEFKGAYFLPTNTEFRRIYGKRGGIYGPELTFEICNNIHGFASFDYLRKNGHSVGLCEPTTVRLVTLAFGAKYFLPVTMCKKKLDLYVGLGFEPVNVRTTNCSNFVENKQSTWAFGGIAKLGAYYHVYCNFVLDLFLDYSFAKTSTPKCTQNVMAQRANVSGAIFGIGVGYLFN